MSKMNKILQKIFSIKTQDDSFYKRTAITILGLKLRFKQSRYLKKEVQKNYVKVIKRIKNKMKNGEKINVIFLSNEVQKWGYDFLYKEFEKSKYFTPKILVIPRKRQANKKDKTGLPLEEQYEFYRKKNYNVEYAYKDGKFIDIKKFNPDIIFYVQLAELGEYDSPAELSQYALTAYAPYGYALTDFKGNYIPNFHGLLYRYFAEHDLNIKRFEKYKRGNSKNCVNVGYPKLDTYIEKNENIQVSKYWKEPEKYKVIYAPHHSIGVSIEVDYNLSTFLQNGKFILELAKKHPETTWIYKPHPLLEYKLLRDKIMTAEEMKNYYKEWEEIGNVFNTGGYINIFKTSDLMITDCESFLSEYLPTGKPLIHPCRKDSIAFNPLGKMLINGYYNTWNNEELEQTFNQLVVEKNDTKKENRLKLINEIMDYNYPASQKIYDCLLNEISDC